jgi:signal transduction histidine kinase
VGKEIERVSRLVHDVRTPLTVIQMLVYTLQTSLPEGDKKMKDLEMIKEETNKIELLMSEYRKELST